MTQNRTVICQEENLGYTDPLIYWLSLPEGYTEEDVKSAAVEERLAEIDPNNENIRGVIEESLEIKLVYPGHIAPTDDWRA